MRRMLAGAVALLGALVGASSLQGQVADLAKASCAQLMDLPLNDRAQLVVWLHGYYAGAAQRAVIDRGKLEGAKAAIEQACERSRAMTLIGVEARAIFLGESPPSASPSPPPAPGEGPSPAPMPR